MGCIYAQFSVSTYTHKHTYTYIYIYDNDLVYLTLKIEYFKHFHIFNIYT